MNSSVIRIAAIGCGRVAEHYKKILDSNVVSNYELVGFYDLVKEKAERLARHFNTIAYDSYDSMLKNSSPDLVLILSPSGHHFEHCKQALNNGCNILIEKPPAMLPSQCDDLESLINKTGLICGVAFQNRFNPSIQVLAKALHDGRFGKIITATIRLRWCRYQDYYNDEWHGRWAQDGGVINQQAIHHVDALNWLLGPVESVSARAANRLNDLEAEDTMVGSVLFKDGALGTIEATTAARPKDFEASLSVVGEMGIVQIGGIALNKVEVWDFINPVNGDEAVPDQFSQEVETGYGLSHGPLLQQMIDTLQGKDAKPYVTIGSAMQTVRLIHALYKSDELNQWVNLEDQPISGRLGKD